GGVELFGGGVGDDGVGVTVNQQDAGLGFLDGVDGPGGVEVEVGEAGGRVGDDIELRIRQQVAGTGDASQRETAEAGDFVANGGKGGDGHHGGDARVFAGVEDGGGGAIGSAVDAQG